MSYQTDYEGIGKMLCAPWMVSEMLGRANAVAERARSIAPHRSGRYAASFSTSAGIRQGRTRRAYGRVTNAVPYAIDVEFGTEDTPAHRTLRTALDAARGK